MSDDRAAEIECRFRAGVEAFNRADFSANAEFLSQDCVYRVAREHPESRVVVGPEEIGRYQRMWWEHLDEIRFDVSGLRIAPPWVLSLGTIHGRGTGSGVAIDVELGMLYELGADLRAVSVEEFLDPAEAVREFEARTGDTTGPTDAKTR